LGSAEAKLADEKRFLSRWTFTFRRYPWVARSAVAWF
jgi:hypothetical protein